MCDSLVEKYVFSKNSLLRPCFDCLRNELKCIKLAVLGKGMDSESRNQTARDIFKENKLSGEINSELTYCETFIDIAAVHVGKELKRQSFANWFLFVDGEKTNLVLLRVLRNDALFRDKICPYQSQAKIYRTSNP